MGTSHDGDVLEPILVAMTDEEGETRWSDGEGMGEGIMGHIVLLYEYFPSRLWSTNIIPNRSGLDWPIFKPELLGQD